MRRLHGFLVCQAPLVALYVLVQIGYPLFGDLPTLVERFRTPLSLWLLLVVTLSGSAWAPPTQPTVRSIGGGIVGLAASLLIPVWLNSDAHRSLVNGCLVAITCLAVGALCARYGTGWWQAPSLRARLVLAVGVIVGVIMTGALTVPRHAVVALTLSQPSGPHILWRDTDVGLILGELAPKPWASAHPIGGLVSIGSEGIARAVDGRQVELRALGGARLGQLLFTDESTLGPFTQLQVAGDLVLIRRELDKRATLASIQRGAVVSAALPAVAGGSTSFVHGDLYSLDGDSLLALGTDGSERWKYSSDRQPPTGSLRFRTNGNLRVHPGNTGALRSIWGITDGLVAPFTGEMVCLSPDGLVRWRYAMPGFLLATVCSPDGGQVYSLWARTGVDGATGVIVSVNRLTGSAEWEWPVPEDIGSLDWATDGATLFLALRSTGGSRLDFAALSTQGSLLWREPATTSDPHVYPLPQGYLVVGAGRAALLDGATGILSGSLTASGHSDDNASFDEHLVPVIWRNQLIVSSSRGISAHDLRTGERQWAFDEPFGVTGLAVSDEVLVIGSRYGLTVLK